MSIRITAPTLINQASSGTNWSAAAGGAVDTATVTLSDGTSGTRVRGVSTSGTNFFIDYAAAFTLAGKSGIEISIYLTPLAINATSANEYSGTIGVGDSGYTNTYTAQMALRPGWNHLRFSRADFVAGGSPGWETTTFARLRLRFNAVTSTVLTVFVDNFCTKGFSRPTVAIVFDDGWATTDTVAFTRMNTYKIPGTVAVIKDKVGSTADYMTTTRLGVLHAAGWAMVNHTASHDQNVLNAASVATCQAEIEEGRDYLISLGFTRDNEHLHFVAPFGEWSANYLLAAQNAGCLSFRGLFASNTTLPTIPASSDKTGNLFPYPTFFCNSATTVADIKLWLDRVIAGGRMGQILFHDLPAAGATGSNQLAATFEAFADYCYLKSALCDFVTLPRYIQLQQQVGA